MKTENNQIIIKPLKPISIIIESRIKYWVDKINGGYYSSAKVYINLNYQNPLFFEYEWGDSRYCEQLIRERLEQAGINYHDSNNIFFTSVVRAKKVDVISWGKESNHG